MKQRTSSQGNIIHTLNGDANPTQLLLRIFESHPGTNAANPASYRFLNERVFVGQVGADNKVCHFRTSFFILEVNEAPR